MPAIGASAQVVNGAPSISSIATFDTGLGANGAEIISTQGDRAAISNIGDPANGISTSIDVLDVSDPTAPTQVRRITDVGLTGITSVAVHPTKDLLVAVAGESTPTSKAGRMLVFRLSDGVKLAESVIAADATYTTGRQPDSVEISPDGRWALVAIEAQQVDATDFGGAGALVVLDLSSFDPATSTTISPVTVELSDLTGTPGMSTGRGYDTDISPRTLVVNTPDGLEPEGIGFAADSTKAWVTLQENNGVVALDLTQPIPAVLPASAAFGVGQTTHLADLTTTGGYVPTESLTAFREPDGIKAVDIAGSRYLVTADEGDTRNALLASGPRGGRTVTVYDAATGAVVADTGSQLDDIAARNGIYPDGRSNRGGSEAEMLDVATFDGRAIVAVGLERANALAFIDITTPASPVVLDVIATGSAPEGVKLVAADGTLYAYSANEASGTVTVTTVPGLGTAPVPFTEDVARTFGLVAADPDGLADTLTVTLTLDPAKGAVSGAGLLLGAAGEYTVTGTIAVVNATLKALTFTPAANVNGQVDLGVSISDGVNAAVLSTVALQGAPVDDPVDAVDDTARTRRGEDVKIAVLANDVDVDRDGLRITRVTRPANGSVERERDGRIEYEPRRGFTGTDSFTYTVTDGKGNVDTATVRVTVTRR